MNDGNIVGILSDFLHLVFEVDGGQLTDVALLEIVNRLGFTHPKGQNHQNEHKNLLARHLRVKCLIIISCIFKRLLALNYFFIDLFIYFTADLTVL